ncbi:MAG: DUF3160 domain-containing protein [Candidatus Falkowbacteria bacterium]
MFEKAEETKKTADPAAPKAASGPDFANASSSYVDTDSSDLGKKIAGVLILLMVLAAAGFGGFWVYNKFIKKSSTTQTSPTAQSDAQKLQEELDQAKLTANLPGNENAGLNTASSTGLGQGIEYLSFSNFYSEPDNSMVVNIDDYKLPINIKSDVLNYYDIARKLNLDKNLNDLNNNGFAIIDNPFSNDPKNPDAKKLNNFYSVYDTLNRKQIPTLITADFITYYHQNIMKKAFKDIEENVFYGNLWDIANQLFETSKSRYNNRLAEVGNINDPILEGARLEMAYSATLIEILKPAEGQINTKNDLSDKSKFTLQEVDDFSFNIPQYLKVDVLKEVQNIREHKLATKSPVMLYTRDYREFVVPEEYKTNAKLNNFYLATRWLNTVFPIYYKNADCPACTLDAEDWRIQMVAASYLAQDVFGDDGLKNKWARIYKVLTFFKGLRDDVSLVNYRDALVELFGADYKIDEIFSDSNGQSGENFKKLQDKIISLEFLDAYGALDKKDPKNITRLGVKMLADFYWPNDYIFSQLTAPSVSTYKGGAVVKTSNTTSCRLGGIYQRCLGFALDVINLIYPIPAQNSYFTENTNYQRYSEQVENIKQRLAALNNTWHNNNYWTTLKTIKTSLENPENYKPVFARNSAWTNKETNRALATWANLQLPADKFGLYQKYAQVENANGSVKFLEYSYIEPNIILINELLANNSMVKEMFSTLKLNNEVNQVAISLNDTEGKLKTIKSIMEKELSNTQLSDDDVQFIDKTIKEFKVDESSSKIFKITGLSNRTLTEDLSDVKLLVLVQKKGNDLVLAVGPIFKYWEKK